jgi:uncharacterized protein YcfJ
MKFAAMSAAAVATVIGGAAVSTPAAAQPYRYYDECRASSGNQTAGAVIGGVAGALLGRSLAGDRHNRTEGAAVGAVAGALIGSQIAKGKDRCRDDYTGYYNNRYYGNSYYSPYARPYARGYYAPTYSRYGYDRSIRYDRYGRPYYGW